MISIIFLYFFLPIVETNNVTIPYVQDVILKPLNDNNVQTFILINTTCKQCLCEVFNGSNNSFYWALNCFPNQTCQLFTSYPQTYKVPVLSGARLYFLQNRFPNASSCCMPNITPLLDRLKNATPLVLNLTFETAVMGYSDTNPNEMAFIGRYGGWVYWIDPTTLTSIRNTSVVNASLSLAAHDDFIYTATDGTVGVKVRHRLNGTLITAITHPLLTKVRKYIFMNNGTRMIVTAQDYQLLAVFDIHSSTNYTFRVCSSDQSLAFYPRLSAILGEYIIP